MSLRQIAHHKLIRSRLNPSLLLTRLTTPILKNLSSPPAVRPPTYHFSAPSTSLNPSLELSLPRRRPGDEPGMGTPCAAAAPRGECSGSWLTTLPVAEGGEMARGFEDADDADCCWA
ncbi:hypothetical protein BN1708_008673 [Verticillium longisporum]|uniref:Uncharacterized protein n=1 Tax=Verticillium longisporum TaxID=100787 RepID=A0A0G4N6M7_VERLO|nr:hypothetical protein BN1708_008673 [Verticillium longisporum]